MTVLHLLTGGGVRTTKEKDNTMMKLRQLFVLTAMGLICACASTGVDSEPDSLPDAESATEIPEAATKVRDLSGTYVFYAWREADGVAEGLDPRALAVTVDGLGLPPDQGAESSPEDVLLAEPPIEENDDVDWTYHFVYGGPSDTGAPPPPPLSGTFNFYQVGARSIKVKTTSSVTSTFYRQVTSGGSWTTLYGPTTYSSCTYAYDCTTPLYALKVNTSWSSGTPNITYYSSTSCSTYRSCP